MVDLSALFDAYDRLVSAAAVVLDEDAVRPAADVGRNVRRRSGFLGESVVIALGGGTGSGKSSLLNALASETVAQVGAIRPTTSRPLAWIPATPEPGLTRLLDDMGVADRIGHDHSVPVAIIDMPDVDSVVGAHRDTFERILPRVDDVWWVVDPEKYNDRLLHKEYLEPLADYQTQFVFVLNQIDRLTAAEQVAVEADLRHRLAADGIDRPQVVAVAAKPVVGEPRNVAALWDLVVARHRDKEASLKKLVIDVRRSAAGLADAAGVSGSTSVEFEARWTEVRDAAAAQLAQMVVSEETTRRAVQAGGARALRVGSGPVGRVMRSARASRMSRALGMTVPDVEGATRSWAARPGGSAVANRLSGLVADVAFDVGGSYGADLRARFGPATIDRATAEAVEVATHHEAGPEAIERRWWRWTARVKALLTLAFVAGALWWYFLPPARGEIPWPIVTVVGALVVGLVLTRLVETSGRRSGRAAVERYAEAIEQQIADRLDRGLGTPLRMMLRERSYIAAAHAEVGVLVAAAEEHLLASPR